MTTEKMIRDYGLMLSEVCSSIALLDNEEVTRELKRRAGNNSNNYNQVEKYLNIHLSIDAIDSMAEGDKKELLLKLVESLIKEYSLEDKIINMWYYLHYMHYDTYNCNGNCRACDRQLIGCTYSERNTLLKRIKLEYVFK